MIVHNRRGQLCEQQRHIEDGSLNTALAAWTRLALCSGSCPTDPDGTGALGNRATPRRPAPNQANRYRFKKSSAESRKMMLSQWPPEDEMFCSSLKNESRICWQFNTSESMKRAIMTWRVLELQGQSSILYLIHTFTYMTQFELLLYYLY